MIILEGDGICGSGSHMHPVCSMDTAALLLSSRLSQTILVHPSARSSHPTPSQIAPPSLILLYEFHSAMGLVISRIYTDMVVHINI